MAKDDPKGGVKVGEAETGGAGPEVEPETEQKGDRSLKPSAPGETGTTPGTNWR